MKKLFNVSVGQKGASATGVLSVLAGVSLLVVLGSLFYSYVMESYRVHAIVGELRKRTLSILQNNSLEMKEFPGNECQGYPIVALQENKVDKVYILRMLNVDKEDCSHLVEQYPTDWFQLFVNNTLDVNHTTMCDAGQNMLDFVFVDKLGKEVPDCENVTCHNNGVCLRGICRCPMGVEGELCTRTTDCAGRENGTRCTLAGRNFDGVCLDGLCQNEGECPTMSWDDAILFCQGHGGLPEVASVYNVSAQVFDSNENGYWMSYLKNPQTRNDYQKTACFMDNTIVWTKETFDKQNTQAWVVELQTGQVLSADSKQRHQVLCGGVFAE